MSKHAIYFPEDKITRDSFKDECDVKKIVERFARTGEIQHVQKAQPQYGESPNISFHEAACMQAEISSQLEANPTLLDQEPPEPPESPPRVDSGEPHLDAAAPTKEPLEAQESPSENGA